jgi:hypothetical protein
VGEGRCRMTVGIVHLKAVLLAELPHNKRGQGNSLSNPTTFIEYIYLIRALEA